MPTIWALVAPTSPHPLLLVSPIARHLFAYALRLACSSIVPFSPPSPAHGLRISCSSATLHLCTIYTGCRPSPAPSLGMFCSSSVPHFASSVRFRCVSFCPLSCSPFAHSLHILSPSYVARSVPMLNPLPRGAYGHTSTASCSPCAQRVRRSAPLGVSATAALAASFRPPLLPAFQLYPRSGYPF